MLLSAPPKADSSTPEICLNPCGGAPDLRARSPPRRHGPRRALRPRDCRYRSALSERERTRERRNAPEREVGGGKEREIE
eukprot:161451-Rhodomonas_salina.1